MSELIRPDTIEEATQFLVSHPDARVLAGGATLIAMRNAGLVEMSHLVSLSGIHDLQGIEKTPKGIRIGAMTRHCETAGCDLLTGSLAVVRQAAGMIANRPVRNMGTMGGAVSNADPAADYLPALACVDAIATIAGPDGRRDVAITEFVEDWYETALGEGEILVSITLPLARDEPSLYRKVARVTGDYATASCAMAMDGDAVRVAIGACGPGPIRDTDAEEELRGNLANPDAVSAFAARLAGLADPIDDVRGSAEYRLALIPRLIRAGLKMMQTAEVAK